VADELTKMSGIARSVDPFPSKVATLGLGNPCRRQTRHSVNPRHSFPSIHTKGFTTALPFSEGFPGTTLL